MSISVRVSGGRNPFQGYRFEAAAERWAAETGPMVRERLKSGAPVGRGPRAGRLRDSIRYEPHLSPSGGQLVFTSDVPYARFVVDGTKAHDIPFKKPQPLLFKVGWRTVRVVHHPGTKANPFPERAIRPLLPAIQARLREITSSGMRG